MADVRMSYSEPLAEGWRWMVEMLFRPFNIGKWLVIAFAAWLAGLAGGGGGGGGNARGSWDIDNPDEMGGVIRHGWNWLMSDEAMAGMIFAAVLTVIAIVLIVLWVSSRGKFIFLDNVVHNRAAIAEPWRRYKKIGNSLFLFRLIAGLLCLPLALGVVGLFAWLAFGPDGWVHLGGAASAAGIVGTATLAFVVGVAALYVVFFLDAFVVPLMFHYDLGVMDAWRRFGLLFAANKGSFLLCGLFVFVLCVLAAIAVMVTGVMTCCLGFMLLVLPYVGTAVLLPLIVTYRAFTVAFLAQLDPELALTAAVDPAS